MHSFFLNGQRLDRCEFGTVASGGTTVFQWTFFFLGLPGVYLANAVNSCLRGDWVLIGLNLTNGATSTKFYNFLVEESEQFSCPPVQHHVAFVTS